MNLQGGCSCKAIRYTLTNRPMFVNACHCLDCQRITGGPFVINLWIEARYVEASGAAPKSFRLKGGSGAAHEVFFCTDCGTYLWSRYHGSPGDCLFLRAGTLDNPAAVKPDAHIFTRSKVPWLELHKDIPAFAAFYNLRELWPAESQERLRRNAAASA